MKKSFLKTFIISLLMSFVFVFSACTNGSRVYVDSYSITQEDSSLIYYAGDNFTLDGYKLTLLMTDGSIKEIMLKDSMIKTKPDMKTSGKKNVVLDYNGQSYSFNIFVDKKEKKDFMNSLKEFLDNYSNLNTLPEELIFDVSAKYSASYLGESLESNEAKYQLSISPEEIKGWDYLEDSDFETLVNIGENNLVKYIYDSLLNSVIRNSFIIENDDILSVENKLVNLDLFKVGKDFFKKIASFDFLYHLVNDILFPYERVTYIEGLTGLVAQNLFIDIDSNYEAKFHLQNFSTGIVNKFLDCKYDKIDIRAELIELCRIVFNYSADGTIKYIINNAANSVLGYDCVSGKIFTDDIDEKHILSDFVTHFSDIIMIYKYDDDGYKVLIENEKAKTYAQNYVNALSTLVRSIEDYLYGTFEAALQEKPFDTKTMLNNIKSASENFINLVDTTCEENGWIKTDLDYTLIQYLTIANQVISLYHDDFRFFISDVVKEFKLVEMLLDLFEFKTGAAITDEMAQMIANIVYDALRPNPNYDYENYIRTVCSIIGIEDETLIESYIKTFEESKTFSLLSDTFTAVLENLKSLEGDSKKYYLDKISIDFNVTTQEALGILEKRIEAYGELVKTLKYLENIPVNGCDFVVLITYLNDLLPLMTSGYIEEEDVRILTQVFFQVVDIKNTIKNNIRQIITKNQVAFSQFLINSVTNIVGFYDKASVQYKELETIINYAVGEYVKGTIDFPSVMNSFFKTVNNYCEGENKILANSLGMMFMIFIGQNSDVSIDYNKLFEYVELPNGVNNIDYNELVNTLWSGSNYSSILKLTDPVVEFIEHSGEIIGEKITFSINLDFDIVVSSFNATANFTVYIPLV